MISKQRTPPSQQKAAAMIGKLKSHSLLTGSAVYLLSNIVNASIPFALLPVLTRYLSPDQYGEVAMFQTLLGALGAFVGLNVAGAANRKFYDGQVGVELKHFIGSCMHILLLSSLGVMAFLFLLRENFTSWLHLQARWIFLAALISAAAVVVQLRLGQWQARKKALHYGALLISQSAINMMLSLLLVVELTQGADGRISAQIWATSICAVIALVLLNRDDLLSFWVWKPAYLKEALHFGVPLIPHIAGGFLLMSVDRFVINANLGLSDAGIYMAAFQFSMSMALVFDAINKAYVPWLFERLQRDVAAEKQQIVKYTYAWFAAILVAVLLAFLIGPAVVRLIAGEAYARAGDVIGLLALGQGFGGMYLMVTNYIFYSKRTGLLSVTTLSSGLINIGLLFVLVRFLGIKGAAIAFSISMGVRFLLTWWVAQKRHPMPWFTLKT